MSPLSGLLGLVLLAGVIFAILNVVQSDAPNVAKVMWILLVLLLPLFGLIIWFFFGPRGETS